MITSLTKSLFLLFKCVLSKCAWELISLPLSPKKILIFTEDLIKNTYSSLSTRIHLLFFIFIYLSLVKDLHHAYKMLTTVSNLYTHFITHLVFTATLKVRTVMILNLQIIKQAQETWMTLNQSGFKGFRKVHAVIYSLNTLCCFVPIKII